MEQNTCRLCTRHVTSPYRRIVGGRIVEGCVSADHDNHLYGESLAWHLRKPAKAIRASLKRMMAGKGVA